MTDTPRTEADPYQWLHDNDFSWDDVNAIAAILDAGGFAYLPAAGELRTAIQAELDAIPTEDDPTRDAFHDGAAAAYSWVLSQLAEAAAGPRDEGLREASQRLLDAIDRNDAANVHGWAEAVRAALAQGLRP